MPRIKVSGPIVKSEQKWIYNLFGIQATSPMDVESAITEANGEELEVIINSPGGYVTCGSEIYTLLRGYKGNVKVEIHSIAASAASVIAMAGNQVDISPTAQIMIHNVHNSTSGDTNAMQHAADVLAGMNQSIANAYVLKTGLNSEQVLEMMNKETWLTAQEAKELGFVDTVMFDSENRVFLNSLNSSLIPEEIINKMESERLDARLRFMKLKGESQ